jgi:hypothetical protein
VGQLVAENDTMVSVVRVRAGNLPSVLRLAVIPKRVRLPKAAVANVALELSVRHAALELKVGAVRSERRVRREANAPHAEPVQSERRVRREANAPHAEPVQSAMDAHPGPIAALVLSNRL